MSRPVLKGLARHLHAQLQCAERLFTLAKTVTPSAGNWSQYLESVVVARRAAATLLHHGEASLSLSLSSSSTL